MKYLLKQDKPKYISLKITKCSFMWKKGDKLDKTDANCKSYSEYGVCMQEAISHVSIFICMQIKYFANYVFSISGVLWKSMKFYSHCN
jgi:hypothetical protein